jgi:hypothetical protein
MTGLLRADKAQAVAVETLTHAAEREITWMFLARIATLRAIHLHQP